MVTRASQPRKRTVRSDRARAAVGPTGGELTVPGELADEPGHLLRRAHQAAVAAFHSSHGRDVTPVQYAVLRALDAQPGIDQVTLAASIALDTSTTADIATRLEAKGWIVRELLPRRQRSLRLSPQGQQVLAQMLTQVQPMYEQLLAPLTADERAELMQLLRRLLGIASMPAAGSGG